MPRYLFRRLLGLVGTLFFVGTVVFFLANTIPGSVAGALLGPDASQQQIAAVEHTLGLDRPLWTQYVDFLRTTVSGDLGYSVYYQEELTPVIGRQLGPSLSLTLLSTGAAILISVPLALFAAWRRGGLVDRLLTPVSVLGVAIPTFWFALMLTLFVGVRLGWLPVTGYSPLSEGIGPWLESLVLPVFALTLVQVALFVRILRDGLKAELTKPYVRAVRAQGASERQVMLRHVLPNAAIPSVTVVGTSLATVLGGVIIIEQIFTIPGMGQLMLQGIQNRDYVIIESATLVIAVIYVVANLIVDLLYMALDPRVRTG